jgi:HSP20 family protein
MPLTLFDLMLPARSFAAAQVNHTVAATDLYQTETAYQLKMDLPGVTGEDLKVQVKNFGRLLTISGERKGTRCAKFSRNFKLHDDADYQHMTAELVDGVLSVSIPKVEPVHPPVVDVPITYGGMTVENSEESTETSHCSSETESSCGGGAAAETSSVRRSCRRKGNTC